MATHLKKIREYDIFQKTLFSIKYEFRTKRCFACIRPVFMKIFFSLLKIDPFWGFHAFLKKKKLKGKFSDNFGENF